MPGGAEGNDSADELRWGTKLPITREEIDTYLSRSHYNQLIGAKLSEFGDGHAEIRLPFDDKLTQHHGFIHGSLIGYLADAACAWAASSVAGDIRTSEYKINLLAPGGGEEFIGRGEVVKVTRRTVVARADVFAVQEGEEKLIAIATATLMRVTDPIAK